jgi:hypothetical protein
VSVIRAACRLRHTAVAGAVARAAWRSSTVRAHLDWCRELAHHGENAAIIGRQPKLLIELLPIRTPLPPDDAHALDETLAWYAEIRSRQVGLNLLVESLLIGWLADAAGQDRSAVIQRVALSVENLLPPE